MASQTSNNASQAGSVASISARGGAGPSSAREKRHDLRIPGLASINLSATAALIGTPYATSHGPPFEYPFPTPNSAASTPHHTYPPISPPGGHNPFQFAPSLVSSGKSRAMGLTMPIFKRSSLPPTSKPSKPPVPPSLREKSREKKSASQAAK
ncbi:hypothetical protein M422DRAFT_31393 [Sphaerobolus stellatus SS14]|uniref:Uncharacterized protein n=1 Tax=Sphaerobolus stellatus (strain SS14) TaxID=990650 RepID=A0A0C9UGM4_SPHS4|nr:hypothetical protein M422DRAFT_31393 [Sphaerobolus stellatus SS14]